MKPNAWRTLIALALVIACVLVCNKPASEAAKLTQPATNTILNHTASTAVQEIAGSYDITGTNEDGSPYKGALEVIKHGDAYQFRWDAGRQYDGVGVQNGGVVAVAFTEGTDGKGCGVVTYEVLGDGKLDGKWAYWGVNEAGTERATRASGSGLVGAYNATGKNPNGSGYTAKLSIAAQAGGYKFEWNNGSNGFGIKQGSTLSVGIGGARCAFVAYEIKADGVLEGVWGGYGSTKTGTEHAKRK